MDENNNQYRHEEFDDCFLCKHPALKHLLTALMAFLGAFAAFYVITDWHFKRMYDPVYQMGRMDKAIMQREKNFDRMEMRALKQQEKMDKQALKHREKFEKETSGFIHVEQTPDEYRIIIDLRPFNNNEKNIEVKTSNNTITINAAGETNNRNKQEIIRYSQTFAFGEKIDANEITKTRDGNNYIITVPID